MTDTPDTAAARVQAALDARRARASRRALCDRKFPFDHLFTAFRPGETDLVLSEADPSAAVDPDVHTPERVAAYLTARGWRQRPKDRNLWDLGNQETVHVHTAATAADYTKRTGLLVSDLAAIYGTGELQILADIAETEVPGA